MLTQKYNYILENHIFYCVFGGNVEFLQKRSGQTRYVPTVRSQTT